MASDFSSTAAAAAATATSFRLAGLQLLVEKDKEHNLQNARAKIAEAAANGANVVCLPECFNSPYATAAFPEYAERVGEGPSSRMLSEAARAHSLFIVSGSIPERDEHDRIYNTCLVYAPSGELIARHRKVHLFDIDVPGRITFRESDTLTAGNTITSFKTPWCNIGVGICYDIRFPELAHLLSFQHECKLLCFPGAFNMTTGPLHWELLLRARAVDNQAYTACISPARNPASTYQAWGHSSVCDPWGKVLATTEHAADIIYADIDLKAVDDFRAQIPVRAQKRSDLYRSAEPRT